MLNIYATSQLINKNPQWAATVATACHILNKDFTEELLFRVTFELSNGIEINEETQEVLMTVTDAQLLEAVEEFDPRPPTAPDVEERLQKLEAGYSTVETMIPKVRSLPAIEQELTALRSEVVAMSPSTILKTESGLDSPALIKLPVGLKKAPLG